MNQCEVEISQIKGNEAPPTQPVAPQVEVTEAVETVSSQGENDLIDMTEPVSNPVKPEICWGREDARLAEGQVWSVETGPNGEASVKAMSASSF